MTRSKYLLKDIISLVNPIKIGLPDGIVKLVNQIGMIALMYGVVLKEVLYVPHFKHNILSVSKMFEKNHLSLDIDKRGCVMQDLSSRKIVARGRVED